MKYLVPVFTLFFILLVAYPVAAASPTPAAEPTGSKLNNQINQLKEKIASRVSELNLVEKRGLIGTVESVSGNQVTVIDVLGKKRFVDVDELTKFTGSTSGANFGLSDLTKGTKISVVGLYNKQSRRLLARFVRISVDPVVVTGNIAAIDTKDFVVTVALKDNKQQKIDISTVTKTYNYNAQGELIKSGFSKLKVGERLIAIGFPDKTDQSLLVTSRVTTFPDLPKDPNITVDLPVQASPSAANANP